MARSTSKTSAKVVNHDRNAENTTLTYALTKVMKAKIILLAQKDRRSTSSWLVLLLEERVDELFKKSGLTEADVTELAKTFKP